MATITENLKRILSAIYGKDVRQAIHDSIEQCEADVKAGVEECNSISSAAVQQCRDMGRQVNESYREILSLLSVPAAGVVYHNGYAWSSPGHGAYSVLASAVTGAQCVAVPVESGAVYAVDTYVRGSTPQWVTIAAIKGTPSDTFFTGIPAEDIHNGGWIAGAVGCYVVTIPAGQNLLLVTSEDYSYGDIKVRRLRI